MWTVTKMLTEDWCEAIELERYAGPLSRRALTGGLPSGVDLANPRVGEYLRRCRSEDPRCPPGAEPGASWGRTDGAGSGPAGTA